MIKNTVRLLLCLLCLLIFPAGAMAHYASVTVDNYQPDPGEKITVTIGFGHAFPGDGKMRRAAYDYASLTIVDPDGNSIPVKIEPFGDAGNLPIQIAFAKKGPHTLILSMKNFASKTTTGYKYQPKNELANVLYSKWSETISKALISVGGDHRNPWNVGTKDRFQIVPLKNPEVIPTDGFMPVKVMFDGKPWRGLMHATYAGFSDKSDTFAYTTKPDKEGVAEIKMLKKGMWLLYAAHAYPYDNKAKADECSFKATLTLQH